MNAGERRYSKMCPHCGYLATVIEKPLFVDKNGNGEFNHRDKEEVVCPGCGKTFEISTLGTVEVL